MGFEPTVELPLHNISNVAPSSTRPSLRFLAFAGGNNSSFFIFRKSEVEKINDNEFILRISQLAIVIVLPFLRNPKGYAEG